MLRSLLIVITIPGEHTRRVLPSRPMSLSRILIAEHIDDRGTPQQIYLELASADHASAGDAAAVHLIAGDVHGRLPVRAVEAVMRRYGRPLDEGIAPDGPALDLGGGRVLQQMRYRAPVDASARDYLVWRTPGEEPLAALSNGVAAALRHLAAAMQARTGA